MNTLTSSPDTQELQAKIDLLTDALSFYARYLHESKATGECLILSPIDLDCGNRARLALSIVGDADAGDRVSPEFGLSTLSFYAVNKATNKADAIFGPALYQQIKDMVKPADYDIVAEQDAPQISIN